MKNSLQNTEIENTRREAYLLARYNDLKKKEKRINEVLKERLKMATKGKAIVLETNKK